MNTPVPLEEPQLRPVRSTDRAEWLRMRSLLWPDDPEGDHQREIASFLNTGSFRAVEPFLDWAVFVSVRPIGGLCGFLEASIRPFAEGCTTTRVGYVEGWFVDDDMRRQGVGKALVMAAEQWAAEQGCTEMASDAHPENTISLRAHRALGFNETGRAVQFHKQLPRAPFASSGSARSHLLSLTVLNDTLTVCKLGADSSIPSWATVSEFFSITRTPEELSFVCSQNAVPDDVSGERGWRCLRVAGKIPFTAVGVLAALTAPLAEAGISIFAISTFDTDYLLVLEKDLAAAVNALRRQGHQVDEP